MASPSSVLTMGLGSWGSPSLLVTLGYGIGGEVVTPITDIGVEWTLRPGLMHYTLAESRMQHTLPENHMHWTLPREDQ